MRIKEGLQAGLALMLLGQACVPQAEAIPPTAEATLSAPTSESSRVVPWSFAVCQDTNGDWLCGSEDSPLANITVGVVDERGAALAKGLTDDQGRAFFEVSPSGAGAMVGVPEGSDLQCRVLSMDFNGDLGRIGYRSVDVTFALDCEPSAAPPAGLEA